MYLPRQPLIIFDENINMAGNVTGPNYVVSYAQAEKPKEA